ncbi:MAG: hypothetical protein E6J78_12220 [Deltaproteobacteria bacterium]|nr:MAG: hypothetical protein E6J78_12220 [Deltaproteobacteria bacterium]
MPEALRNFAVQAFGTALLAALLGAAALVGPALWRNSRALERAAEIEQRLRSDDPGSLLPAQADVEAQLRQLEAAVPAERRDLEVLDRLRAAARNAGALNVEVAAEGGARVAPPRQRLESATLFTREPAQLHTAVMTMAGECHYGEFLAFLDRLAHEPGLHSLESVSLERRPPRVSWRLTLKAAHW